MFIKYNFGTSVLTWRSVERGREDGSGGGQRGSFGRQGQAKRAQFRNLGRTGRAWAGCDGGPVGSGAAGFAFMVESSHLAKLSASGEVCLGLLKCPDVEVAFRSVMFEGSPVGMSFAARLVSGVPRWQNFDASLEKKKLCSFITVLLCLGSFFRVFRYLERLLIKLDLIRWRSIVNTIVPKSYQ
jgi:hypothetical protein